MTLVTAKNTSAWTRIAAPIYTQSWFHTVAIFGNDVVNTLCMEFRYVGIAVPVGRYLLLEY